LTALQYFLILRRPRRGRLEGRTDLIQQSSIFSDVMGDRARTDSKRHDTNPLRLFSGPRHPVFGTLWHTPCTARCEARRVSTELEMSLPLPFRNVNGMVLQPGVGRARSPCVAQRRTGVRCMGADTAPVVLSRERVLTQLVVITIIPRHVDKLRPDRGA
jgi:hypothetical protein